jgi:ABC-type amino acid transport substrate-binding protein
MDKYMHELYRARIGTVTGNAESALRHKQRIWMGERNLCARKVKMADCVNQSYTERISELGGVAGLTSTPSASAFPASGSGSDLMVATGSRFEPMFNMTGAKPTGFDLDLARALAKKVGKKDARFKSSSSARKAAQDGSADIGIAAISITPERSQMHLFTVPYLTSKFVVLTATDSHDELTLSKLSSTSCAAGRNSLYKGMLKKTGCSIKVYKSPSDALDAVRAGEVDIAVTDETAVAELVARGGIQDSGIVLGSDQYGIVVQRGNHALKEALDTAIKEFRTDGTIDELKLFYGIW